MLGYLSSLPNLPDGNRQLIPSQELHIPPIPLLHLATTVIKSQIRHQVTQTQQTDGTPAKLLHN